MLKVSVVLSFEKDDDLLYFQEIAESSKQTLAAVLEIALHCHACRLNGNDWCNNIDDEGDGWLLARACSNGILPGRKLTSESS